MFFGRCDLVFERFKNRPRLFKSHANRDKCGANRSRDVREKLAGEKKKKVKSKPTEKYNITEILKNCIFAKTAI